MQSESALIPEYPVFPVLNGWRRAIDYKFRAWRRDYINPLIA